MPAGKPRRGSPGRLRAQRRHLEAGFPDPARRLRGQLAQAFDLNLDGSMEVVIGDDAAGCTRSRPRSRAVGWPVHTQPGRVVRHPASRAFTHAPTVVPAAATSSRTRSRAPSSPPSPSAISIRTVSPTWSPPPRRRDLRLDAAGQIRPGFPRNTDGHTTAPTPASTRRQSSASSPRRRSRISTVTAGSRSSSPPSTSSSSLSGRTERWSTASR